MIFDYQAETMSPEQRRELQGRRLAHMVQRIYEHVPLYRQKMDACGITPADVRSLDDLSHLPFTEKEDLRDNYPLGMLAVPKQEVVRLHASSGTTGKRTVVAYTQNDIAMWSKMMARTLAGAGGSAHDIVQVAYGYGLFTGGLGAHNGAERLGAITVPASTGNTKLQLQMIMDFGATMICCTPSYALYIAEIMEEQGISPQQLPLQRGCFGAEPWSEEMRTEIEARLGLKAYDIYGLSEVIGPGVAFECEAQDGLHINEDHFIPEIVDPGTGQPLPAGHYGELVFTCVTKQAMPLLRYRTHDIAMLQPDICCCGRTLVRMSKPSGRVDDMLIIRGINVFPSQIESILLAVAGATPHYQLIVERKGALDSLEVKVEMTPALFADTIRKTAALQHSIEQSIAELLGVSATVSLVEPKSLPRSEGKAVHVIDKRHSSQHQ